jgi:hypothetical protein
MTESTAGSTGKESGMNHDQIKHLVSRFLAWPLPENFNPDGGITFEPIANKGTAHEHQRHPVGTNLLDATQAAVMVEHMVEGLPTPEKPEPNPEWEAKAKALRDQTRMKAEEMAAELDEPVNEPEATLTMLERWTADAEPANEHGQVSFSRAMLESAEDTLRGLIAERGALKADNERLTKEVAIWKQCSVEHDATILPIDRDRLGREVREAWVNWAKDQPSPKPYDALTEADKEADRLIGEHLAVYLSRAALEPRT